MEKSSEQSAEQQENTYVIDVESPAEMARLMRQDQLITEGMGGLFPENNDLSHVDRMLDIACGPGGWVLEAAFKYPNAEVVGVDISQKMIAYAQAQARAQGLTNASFAVMSALEPLDFPDESFDVVNARFILAFMRPSAWPALLQECLRILRPNGIIRLTEMEGGGSNKFAYQQTFNLLHQSLLNAGQSFSRTSSHIGVIPMLRRLVQDAGYINVQKTARIIEFSSGTDLHDSFFHDLASGFKLLQPFLIKWKVSTQEDLNQLYSQVLIDMQEEDFCALWVLLTVWGRKPSR